MKNSIPSLQSFPICRLATVILLLLGQAVHGQTGVRREIRIPDILNYKTLKCDFHIHTVFSDGLVWPTIRVEEAWRQGLDAISITEHVEAKYKDYKMDVSTLPNRSYESAKSDAEALDILLIRGAEITRDMPPGHFNAIFLQDTAPLNTENFMDAVKAAIDQGAFVFWNHPGWTGQQPDGISKWYDIQTDLINKGWLQGIEIINFYDYYPLAQQWCIEKNLTLIGSSDTHDPIHYEFNYHLGEHRPITLVFARERTISAIHKALQDKRTAVFARGTLYGDDRFLREIFNQSVSIINQDILIQNNEAVFIQIRNQSDINYTLESEYQSADVSFPDKITLPANSIVRMRLSEKSKRLEGKKDIRLPFTATNLQIAPNQGLRIFLSINIQFKPAIETE